MAEEQKIRLGFDTDLPEKAAEAAEAVQDLAEGMTALDAVVKQISDQGEEVIGGLGEAAKESAAPTADLVDELVKTGTVVKDLEEKIRQLKEQHEELNEARKAELITEGHYKEASDALLKTLRDKETILDRLTKAEREQEKAEEERIEKQMRLEEKLQAAYEKESAARLREFEKQQQALARLEAASEKAAAAQTAMAEAARVAAATQAREFAIATASAEALTGFGDGEEGKGGLAGAAAGVLKLERASVGLATGHGIRGATNALESLALAAGGPAGVGLAIGGIVTFIDVVLPKLQSLRDAMIGITESTKAAAKALQEQKEQAEKNQEAVDKLSKKLPASEEAKEIAPFTEGKKTDELESAIVRSLGLQGEGAPTTQQVSGATAAATDVFGRIDKAALNKNLKAAADQNRINEANRLILAATHSQKARDRLREIGQNHPDLFPSGFLEKLDEVSPEGRRAAEVQATTAEAQSAEAEEIYGQREAASKETLDIQQEFNKAFQDRRKLQDKQFESTMRSDEAFEKKREAVEKQAEAKAEQLRRHAAVQAEQLRRRDEAQARENMPSAINARQRRAEENEAIGLVQQNTQGFSPDEQSRIAGHLKNNYDMGLAVGHSVAEQIQFAIMQTRADVARGIQDAIRRNQVFTESFVQ